MTLSAWKEQEGSGWGPGSTATEPGTARSRASSKKGVPWLLLVAAGRWAGGCWKPREGPALRRPLGLGWAAGYVQEAEEPHGHVSPWGWALPLLPCPSAHHVGMFQQRFPAQRGSCSTPGSHQALLTSRALGLLLCHRVGGTGGPHPQESTVGARAGQAGLWSEQGGQESALSPEEPAPRDCCPSSPVGGQPSRRNRP